MNIILIKNKFQIIKKQLFKTPHPSYQNEPRQLLNQTTQKLYFQLPQ